MKGEVLVVGAGLCGSLLAGMLGREGWSVRVVEKRDDPRSSHPERRAIHLVISERAREILAESGLEEAFGRLSVPVRARVVHGFDGRVDVQPYGARSPERGADRILKPAGPLYAVDRRALAAILVVAADRSANVEFRFRHEVVDLDLDRPAVRVVGPDGGRERLDADLVVGADGAFSRVRASMVEAGIVEEKAASPPIEYRQLSMTGRAGEATLRPDAHHLWTRRGAVLSALPRPDGSFAAGLFLPTSGATTFASLAGEGALERFFRTAFPHAAGFIQDLPRVVGGKPIGRFATVRCRPWHAGRTVLAGDAGHAFVPFSGQGANAALEDAVVLAQSLSVEAGLDRALEAYARRRLAETEVVSDLSDVLGPLVLWLAGAVRTGSR